jgi:hypothetical protein
VRSPAANGVRDLMTNQNVSIDDDETSAAETDAGPTLSAAERAELMARCREHQAILGPNLSTPAQGRASLRSCDQLRAAANKEFEPSYGRNAARNALESVASSMAAAPAATRDAISYGLALRGVGCIGPHQA